MDRAQPVPGAGSPGRALVIGLLSVVLAACGGAAPAPAPTVPAPPPAATAPAERPVTAPTSAPVASTPAPAPATASTAATPASAGLAPLGPTERAQVLRVVDGDTIEIDRGYGPEPVRYIGVDTPETVHPTRPVEWMGKEASAMNRTLVEGREVLLERDISETDRYGRLLRYVWVEDPASGELLFVNRALVELGFAQVVTYPPDVRWVDTYLAVQAEARAAGRGLWGTPTGGGSTGGGSTGGTGAAGGSGTSARGGCDPAYPDVCIPPSPPDLDCGDIPYRSFRVLPPDPHRFDGGGDGVGCEGG